MNTETDHPWTREQMATALADGLSADDRARFDAHLAACASCSEKFAEMTRREADLAALFADARPAPGFEDRLIRNLRQTKPARTWVHPMVRRAAVGVAATLVLASAGYVVSSASNEGMLPDLVALMNDAKPSPSSVPLAPATQPFGGHAWDYDNATTAFKINSVAQRVLTDGRLGGSNGRTDNFGLDATPGAVDIDQAGKSIQDLTKRSAQPKKIPFNDAPGDPTNGPAVPGQRVGGQASKPGEKGSSDPLYRYDAEGPAKEGRPISAAEGVKLSGGFARGSTVETRESGAEWWLGRAVTPLDTFKPAQLGLEVTQAVEPKAVNGGVIVGDQLKEQKTTPVALQAGDQGWQKGKQPAAPTAGAPIVPTESAPPAQQSPSQPQPSPAGPSRKVIRTGVMEFEVDRFDAALAMITKLTQEAGGYIGTTDSEKLPNNKVKGSVIVRVPPERLDTLVLQLRGIGDLRSQKMDAQDVTKQYTDLEGELRAARAMEERLLEIIKTGKGEIKDLLAAEKELGVWRTKIEKMVGEMRYYDNLVSLTTLTITAFERDIRTAATSKETETVRAGIETDDVEGARAAALKAIDEAKGRVIQSDLKRHDAGQFSAQVVADVGPDAAGPLIDRLKQLGKVARFEVQRKQTTPDGTTQPAPGARLERAETRIHLSLYNLANVAPRQTTNLNLAAIDAEAAYQAIAARVEKASGRIVTSNLTRPQADQVVGTIHFEVKTGDAEAVLGDVRRLGEVMRLTVTENPDTNNVTTAKQGFVVQLAAVAAVPARESTNLQIASSDVPAAYHALRDAVRGTPARVTTSQLNEAVRENVTANIEFEAMRADLPAIEEALKTLGDVTQRTSGRSADTENTVDSKVRMQVSFIDADQLPPRETTALGIETSDPDKALADLQSIAIGAGGRVIESNLSQERGGHTIAKLVVDVPLAKSVELITRAKGQGSVRMVQSTKDAQVPDGSLARARIDITFATSEGIVAPEQGLWSTIRRGLAASMTGLMWSLQLIIIGLCFVGPWVLLIMLGWKLLRRKKSTPAPIPA